MPDYEPTDEDREIEARDNAAVQNWLFNILMNSYNPDPEQHYRNFQYQLAEAASAILPTRFEDAPTIHDELGIVFLPRRPWEIA